MQFDDSFPMMLEVEMDVTIQGGKVVASTGMPRQNCPPVSVSFGMQPHQDQKKTAEFGTPQFFDMEYVKIAVPGERNSLYFQPATDLHKQRFPRAYQAFKQRQPGDVVEGLPVEQWAAITRSQALTLRAGHIPTVEALAAVHEGNVDRLGHGGRELRAKAIAFLEQAKSSKGALKIASEKEALQRELDGLKAQMADLLSRIPAEVKGKVGKHETNDTYAAQIAAKATAALEDDDVEADVVKAVRKPRRAA